MDGIDAVTGATITSNAVVEAVNSLAAAPAEEAAPVEEAPAAEEAPAEAVPAAKEKTATATGFVMPGADEETGKVTVNATIDGNNTITALTVDASTQTPGIGRKYIEEEYAQRFIGKTLPLAVGTDIDTIAGATHTTAAIIEALNSLAD